MSSSEKAIRAYLKEVQTRYKTGISREHSYRGDLQNLLQVMLPSVLVTNEPARIECGAPDYILTRKDIQIGHIEAKDIGAQLDSKTYKEQFTRYRKSLPNLIITNYLQFWFYIDGDRVATVDLADIEGNKITSLTSNFKAFSDLVTDFAAFQGQTITSAQKLSKMMAGKAKLLARIIEKALDADDEGERVTDLQAQYGAFKEVLIHDIKHSEFADIYSQTIAYGMFAARLHDPTLEDFSRQEAAALIPKTNPFLRKLFTYIAANDLDERISWLVDALAEIFQATDVAGLLKDFGKATQQNDPIIHFYETFLAEYDPKLRKARGVWYTPEPVVNFIVRAVDDILKTEFGLPMGLADTSKTTIKVDALVHDKRTTTRARRVDKEVHKVQILDPAAGTGTFLAEVIKQIHSRFKGQEGIWSTYVENDLIPRLNGFEILMASYAMAHLKLDMLLTETGYKPTIDQRFRVFLTNSLEKHHPDTGTLFASWLSNEASEANHIKRDAPIMVVLGNPPYSVSSSNKGKWIQTLIGDYKKDLKERKLNLDDDYIKFLRYGQYLIEKNGEGVLAFITNNSFIDGATHRQMRKTLLSTFDDIYVLNLHGDSKKNEKAHDGSSDENVFDIQQGVSINIFVKTKKRTKKLATLKSIDLYGKRKDKYKYLVSNNLSNIPWDQPLTQEPYYYFMPKDYTGLSVYNKGFNAIELFKEYNSGIQTKRDKLTIHHNRKELSACIEDFAALDLSEIKIRYGLPEDGRDWKLQWAKDDLDKGYRIVNISYRTFDDRVTAYTGKTKGFIAYPRNRTSVHMLYEGNTALVFKRSRLLGNQREFNHFSICKHPADINYLADQSYFFPLYLYGASYKQKFLGEQPEREPNFDEAIVQRIVKNLGINFSNEKTSRHTFSPIDIIDYFYAVMSSPRYRRKYKEFLKEDFPRVPYPENRDLFWQLVKLGSELRQLHLLESSKVDEFITTYPKSGNNVVNRKIVKKDFDIIDSDKGLGRVWINDEQYFDGVPVLAWEFYIGGYQPAQKWLKDRKGRELSYEDILHYQKIIVALSETDRIMKEIDLIFDP